MRHEELYHSIAYMYSAGIPIQNAFRTAAGNARGRLPNAVRDVADRLIQGESLKAALAAHPRVFPPQDVAILVAGDRTGSLQESFNVLASWHEWERNLIRDTITRIVYPAFLIHFATLIFPAVALIRSWLGVGGASSSPVLTFFLAWGRSLLPFYVAVFAVWAIRRLAKGDSPVRWLLDRVFLAIPVLGQGLRDLAISRYTRAFNAAYQAGVPLAETLDLAEIACGNSVVLRGFNGMRTSLLEGTGLAKGLRWPIPKDDVSIWATAESSGKLADSLDRIAHHRQESSERWFKAFTKGLTAIIIACVMIYLAYFIISFWVGYIGGMMDDMPKHAGYE